MSTPLSIDGFAPLGHWHPIRARGADAAAFLQGQLTNDVATMDERSLRLAGFCSAKGRLQASFVVWRPAVDEFVLACAASVAQATLKRLSMFVLRAKCRLSDAAGEIRLVGAAGASARNLVAGLAPWQRRADGGDDGLSVMRLSDVDGVERCIVAAPGDVGREPALALSAWQRLEIRSGIPAIEAATSDRFVPQMVNFEAIGGVDFGKGCYPGQEVVARSQYRGTLKRRMFVFECDGRAEPGAEVFDELEPDQPAGMIVNASADDAGPGSVALVEVKLAALGNDRLRVGSTDGPRLRGGTLPYDLPSVAA